jgi:hypothetical protein
LIQCEWVSNFFFAFGGLSPNVVLEYHLIIKNTHSQQFQESKFKTQNKGCVTHYGLAISVKKYLKAKEELWKFKYFTMQKYNLQKNPLQETKILQDIITL